MAAIILAGGFGVRMGSDKASLPIAGTTLIQLVISRFAGELGPVVVSLRGNQSLDLEDCVVARDVYEGAGPMAGLHAGLLASPDDINFALACDMPLAEPRLARYLLSLAAGRDAVVPALERGLEPLFAAYRKTCLPEIEACLRSGEFRVRSLLDRIDTLYVPESDIRRIDPELQSFLNVNTPEDYAKAVRL